MSILSHLTHRAVDVFSRAKDEIIKVSQIGKVKISQGFLKNERQKLLQKLGELAYQQIQEGRLELKGAERLVNHIDRVTRRLSEMHIQVQNITHFLSTYLDLETSRFRRKEKIRKISKERHKRK